MSERERGPQADRAVIIENDGERILFQREGPSDWRQYRWRRTRWVRQPGLGRAREQDVLWRVVQEIAAP